MSYMSSYPGPLRDGPLAVELHNTIYVGHGAMADGLQRKESAAAFLAALAPRLPAGGTGPPPSAEELFVLRGHVRDALSATVDGYTPGRATLEALNVAAAAAPLALQVTHGTPPELTLAHPGASRSQVVIATFSADAIALIAGPRRDRLHRCSAPGCVLAFLGADPRRRWCSDACGNRARQARHYRRTRG
jgi:predicted RNA-binding Zn ribbon-like protein